VAWAAAIAIGVWWTANTVSHAFIHRRFFRSGAANLGAAACLTLVMGVPLPLWRERHLAHHAGAAHRLRWSRELAIHAAFVLAFWIAIAVRAPWFFASAYLPGYLAGLLLCAAHGHYEHAGATTSHYGRFYNLVCFNDGYHVEHHRYPGLSWRRLPAVREPGAPSSAWPAPLRWIEGLVAAALSVLERIVLWSPVLQRFVVRVHTRAIAAVLPADNAARVAIVGGGLFPRTALVVRALLPRARITIIDQSRENLARARAFLGDHAVTLVHDRYVGRSSDEAYDIVVFPLAFQGDREAIYAHPPAPITIVHDWIWRPRGVTRVVSLALLKRINLVRR
jgi:hypothetical protein